MTKKKAKQAFLQEKMMLLTKASKRLTNKMMVKIKEMMVKIGKMKDGNKFHM